MTTDERGPGCLPQQPGPSTTSPNPTPQALQDVDPRLNDTARANRIATLHSIGAAWAHFRARGLTSETVRDTLQQILREAA